MLNLNFNIQLIAKSLKDWNCMLCDLLLITPSPPAPLRAALSLCLSFSIGCVGLCLFHCISFSFSMKSNDSYCITNIIRLVAVHCGVYASVCILASGLLCTLIGYCSSAVSESSPWCPNYKCASNQTSLKTVVS